MENNFIDNLAKNALHNYEAPFDPADWEALDQRLDKQRRLAPRLWLMTLVEVIIMALALFTLYNMYTTRSEPTLDDTNPAYFNESESGKTSSASRDDVPPTDAVLLLDETADDNSTPQQLLVPLGGSQLPKLNAQQTLAILNAINGNAPQPTQNLIPLEFINPVAAQEIVSSLHNSSSAYETLDLHELTPAFLSKITSSEAYNSPITQLLAQNDLAPNKPKPTKRHQKLDKGFLFAFSPDVNMLFNAGNTSLRVSVMGSYVQYLTSRLSVQAGLRYSVMRYYDKEKTILPNENNPNDNFSKIVQNRYVSMQKVEVPLNLRYDLYENHDWRIYAIGGLSLNAIATSSNDVSSKIYGTDGSIVSAESTAQPASNNGIFQGGSFKTNQYFSGNIGAGFERKASKHISVFLQPTYSHGFSNAGGDNNKIGSLSLVIGLRFTH